MEEDDSRSASPPFGAVSCKGNLGKVGDVLAINDIQVLSSLIVSKKPC